MATKTKTFKATETLGRDLRDAEVEQLFNLCAEAGMGTVIEQLAMLASTGADDAAEEARIATSPGRAAAARIEARRRTTKAAKLEELLLKAADLAKELGL